MQSFRRCRPRYPPRHPYCQKVNYTADWGFLLTNIVCVDPGGARRSLHTRLHRGARARPPLACAAALPFAKLPFPLRCPSRRAASCAVGAALCAAHSSRGCRPFACQGVNSHRRLHTTRSFLLDVLNEENGPLQICLLEMNLPRCRWPTTSWPTTCSRRSRSPACSISGLVQRAIEHYENLDDLKRVLVKPEFLVQVLPHPELRDLHGVPAAHQHAVESASGRSGRARVP